MLVMVDRRDLRGLNCELGSSPLDRKLKGIFRAAHHALHGMAERPNHLMMSATLLAARDYLDDQVARLRAGEQLTKNDGRVTRVLNASIDLFGGSPDQLQHLSKADILSGLSRDFAAYLTLPEIELDAQRILDLARLSCEIKPTVQHRSYETATRFTA
jgi:hypothetical protein